MIWDFPGKNSRCGGYNRSRHSRADRHRFLWQKAGQRKVSRPCATCAASLANRNPVKLFHRPEATKQFPGTDEAIFPTRDDSQKQISDMNSLDQQRGLIMWDIIISLIYHQSCRNYLAAARKQRELWV